MIFLTFLRWLLTLLQGKPVIPDEAKDPSTPDTTIEVVKPAITGSVVPVYMVPAMVALLKLIRTGESGKAGYNADYRNNNRWTLTYRTFDQVRTLSRSQVTQGHEASSAIGAYQFLSTTLDSLKASLGLKGTEVFSEHFQDDLAVALMIRRGLMDYRRGAMTINAFCNNLAKEWASLPVVTNTQGQRRAITAGQSYYAGDGLNKSSHKPEEVLTLVRQLKQEWPA